MSPEPSGRKLTSSQIVDAKISIWALAFFVIVLALYLPGCVSAPVSLPISPAKACAALDLPAVPQKVYLKIDGDKIDADENGELLLRGYVRARYLLR